MGDVRYRVARRDDVPQLRTLFTDVFPIKYDEKFYAQLGTAIAIGSFEGQNGRVLCYVARREGRTVGAILLLTQSLRDARVSGQVPFDIVSGVTAGGTVTAAYVMMLGVARDCRREGVGSDLVFNAIRKLATMESIGVVYLHTMARDTPSNAFYESLHFTLLGRVPGFYAAGGKPEDAHVWAQPLQSYSLVEYLRDAEGRPADLTNPQLPAVHVSRVPKWARDFALQFLLPLGIVAVLFGISYLLVLAGPLKGISTRLIKPAAGAPAGGDGDDEDL